MTTIRLTEEEIRDLTNYAQPRLQVARLRELGFPRARLDRMGRAYLERSHYESVCGAAPVKIDAGPELQLS